MTMVLISLTSHSRSNVVSPPHSPERQEETEKMKLEKWEELENAQSAPLAAGMTDLKGSDIPGSSAASSSETPG